MILVVGSTGSLGMYVVKALTASHKKVVALVRDTLSDKAKELRSAGAALVVGHRSSACSTRSRRAMRSLRAGLK